MVKIECGRQLPSGAIHQLVLGGLRHGPLSERLDSKRSCGMAYDYDYVFCDKSKGVLKILMNQPETLNTLTPQLENNVHQALYEGDADPEAFCMVIGGVGPFGPKSKSKK